MSETAIQVEHLWKEYRLGTVSHHTLTRDLQSWWARVRRTEDPNSPVGSTIMQPSDDKRFWALQDISFEIKRGDLVGVIGRNGAGKSTLLKILSRVTAPTRGEVRYNGRIASLLEVGTGFHPELTGRENIFLNGAIMGMSKEEIRRKLEEIVSFAEIESFLDTPVKRYSSGMYVRLAFAVAAHLEPEILIVDEVLAVGDAQFQEKCLGRMQEVGKEGRTVIFVSHNMGIVKQLCNRAIVLKAGVVGIDADVETAVREYQETFRPGGDSIISDKVMVGKAYMESIYLSSQKGLQSAAFFMNQDIRVASNLVLQAEGKYTLSFQIKEMNDIPLFHFPCADANFKMPVNPGKYRVSVLIPPLFLYPGRYRMQATLCEVDGSNFSELQIIEISFVIEQDYGVVNRTLGRHAGVIYSDAKWDKEPLFTENKISSP